MKKIVVTAPVADADAVRAAMGEADAGRIGNYTFCSFSSRGIGRFVPGPDANPAIGTPGTPEEVEEVRIEVTCEDHLVAGVIAAVRRAHSYEEPAIDIYPLESSQY